MTATSSTTAPVPHVRRTATSPYLWAGLAVVAGTVGLTLSLTSTALPHAEATTAEDAVDLYAALLFGLVGAELLRRRRSVGLGRALLLIGVLDAVNYLVAGVADALTDGRVPPPALAQVGWLASETTFIAGFFLIVYAPLALFPTGRLPSPRWRWLTAAAVAGVASLSLSLLLAPGPVDEDNPATGPNPLGVEALRGVTEALELIATALLFVTLVGGLAAFAVRWVRLRGARRRQLAWLTTGVVVLVLGLVTDFDTSSVLVEVLTALAIFGTLLVGIAWPLLGPLGDAAEREDAARAG